VPAQSKRPASALPFLGRHCAQGAVTFAKALPVGQHGRREARRQAQVLGEQRCIADRDVGSRETVCRKVDGHSRFGSVAAR
jgi:hypothetical protein